MEKSGKIVAGLVSKLDKLKKSLEGLTRTLATITAIVAIIQAVLNLPFPFLIPIKIRFQPILQKLLMKLKLIN